MKVICVNYTILSKRNNFKEMPKMARFSKFKLYLHKNNILIGVNFIKKYKNLVVSKSLK